tara:strand:- start:173 stop:748 length:576 start_codon:yes stop_codon:yes gene_type:complete
MAEAQQDQSMEEILQSIKRIIADESDEADTPMAEDTTPAPLELTDMVEEDGTVTKIESDETLAAAASDLEEPEADMPDVSGPSLEEMMAEDSLPEPTPAEAPAPNPAKADLDEGLVSDNAMQASMAALQSLTGEKPKPAATSTTSAPFRSGQTVEDLVVEALKPMLKEWLDANLPQVVERLVQKEIRRLSE